MYRLDHYLTKDQPRKNAVFVFKATRLPAKIVQTNFTLSENQQLKNSTQTMQFLINISSLE
jgi:hypothetical protein